MVKARKNFSYFVLQFCDSLLITIWGAILRQWIHGKIWNTYLTYSRNQANGILKQKEKTLKIYTGERTLISCCKSSTHGSAHHGVRFSGSCLTVGKNAGIITLESVIDNLSSQVLEYLKSCTRIRRQDNQTDGQEMLPNPYLFLRSKISIFWLLRPVRMIKWEFVLLCLGHVPLERRGELKLKYVSAVLTEMSNENNFSKIPKPLDCRWPFYSRTC